MLDDKNGDSPIERFGKTLGKLLSVSKEKLDEALEAEKTVVEEVEESIKPASSEEIE